MVVVRRGNEKNRIRKKKQKKNLASHPKTTFCPIYRKLVRNVKIAGAAVTKTQREPQTERA
jgi:hypothetical protein